MNTAKLSKAFVSLALLATLSFLPQSALAATSYTNWPATADWVDLTNHVNLCYQAILTRCKVANISTNGFHAPTYIYPAYDYRRLIQQIEALCPYFVCSTNFGSDGTLNDYFSVGATNTTFPMWTRSALLSDMGLTDWATNTPIHLWMTVDHGVQTQVVAAIQRLLWTQPLFEGNVAGPCVAGYAECFSNTWNNAQAGAMAKWTNDCGGGGTGDNGSLGYFDSRNPTNWLYQVRLYGRREKARNYYLTPLNTNYLHAVQFYPRGIAMYANMYANSPVYDNLGFPIRENRYTFFACVTSMLSFVESPSFGTNGIPPTWCATPAISGKSTSRGYRIWNWSGVVRWTLPDQTNVFPNIHGNVEDLDTDRDDLVDTGADLTSLGPDTGAIFLLAERDNPSVAIPLATTPAWYGGPAVHDYLAQGGTTNLPFQYLVPNLSDEDGPYQANSINTRVLESGFVTNSTTHIKRAAVLRPRGNIVVFDFPWNDGTSSFSPLGYPTGVNSNRTYVLRAVTADNHTNLQYDLLFSSGIIHQFGGGLTNILSADGLPIPISTNSLPSAQLSFPASMSDAKYNVALSWNNGMLNQVTYASKDGSQTITATIASDPATRMITGISKSGITGIDQSNASVSGNTITYDWGTVTRSQTAPAGQARSVTITSSPTGFDTVTETTALNEANRVTSAQTTVGGNSVETSIVYNQASGRYDNGFPKQAKISQITYPDQSTVTCAYDPNTGWLTQKSLPISGDLTRTVSYNYSSANDGDAANVSNLVERPRSVTVSLNGTAVAKTMYSYSAAARTIIQQTVNASAAWGDSGNLTTTITNAVGGLTNGLPLYVAGPAVTSTWSYAIDGLSAGLFTAIGKLTATEVRNTGVTVSNTLNAFSYPVSGGIRKSAGAGSTAYDTSGFNVTTADSFGRVLGAAYSDGTSETKTDYCLWGPQNVTRCDQTTASVQYDLFGNVHTLTEPDISSVTTITADPVGLQTTRTVVQGGVTRTFSEQKNLLGRMVNYSDPLSTNTWNYAHNGNGCWTITLQRSGLGDITTEVNADGSVSKVYGPGAEKCVGFALSAQNGCPVLTATVLNADGSPTTESATTVCNPLGLPASFQQAGVAGATTVEYDTAARPWRLSDESGITQILNYDPIIGIATNGIKVAGDPSTLIAAGQDRMTSQYYAVDATGETHCASAFRASNNGTATQLLADYASHDGRQASLTFAGKFASAQASAFTGPAAFTLDTVLPTGSSTHETYGPLGLATSQRKDANGSQIGQTTFTPAASGLNIQLQDTLKGTKTLTFDTAGRFDSSDAWSTGGFSMSVQYLPGTDLPTSIIGGGKNWSCQYYPNGLPRIVSESGSPTAEYAWDTMGRLASMTLTSSSGTVAVTTWERNAQTGRLAFKKVNGVTIESYTWKPNGQPDIITRPNGTVTCQYNAAGDRTAILDTSANYGAETITTAYNRSGDELTNAVAGGIAEGYTRHIEGTLLGVQVAGGGVVPSHTLDLPQNLSSGQALGFSLASSSGTRNCSVAYGPAATVTNVTDGSIGVGITWVPSGHATNLLSSMAGVPVLSQAMQWNESLGVRSTMTYRTAAGAVLASFAFERGPGTNRISAITREDGSRREVSYDGSGRLSGWKYKNAAGVADYDRSFVYSYDDANNLISAGRDTNISGGPAQMSPMCAQYATQNIRPTSMFDVNALNLCTVRRWNAVDLVCMAATNARVTVNGLPARRIGTRFVVSIPLAQNSPAQVTNLTVCAVVSVSTNLEYFCTNTVALTLPVFPETITTALGSAVLSDSTTEYLYDSRNQLRRVTDKAGATAIRQQSLYDYYPDGRRARKTVTRWNGSAWQSYRIVQYIWDRWNLVREIMQENDVTTTRDYAWGLDLAGLQDGQWAQDAGGIGGLLAVTEVSGTRTNIFFPICDQVGTVHALVAAMTNNVALTTPVVVASFEYEPHGRLVSADGPYVGSCSIGFMSKVRDSETELVYFGGRYADEKSGRWLSADPAGELEGGANLFAMCNCDPVNKVDPLGLATWDGTFEVYLKKYGDKGLLMFQLFMANYDEKSGTKPGIAVGSTGWSGAATINDATKVATLSATASDEKAAVKLHSLLSSRYDTTAARVLRNLVDMQRGGSGLAAQLEEMDAEANGRPYTSDAQLEYMQTLAKASNRASEFQNDARDELVWAVVSIAGMRSAELAIDGLKAARASRAVKNMPLLLTQGTQVPNAGGVIRSFLQETDRVYYRVFTTKQRGGFLTAIKPNNSAFAQEALALPPENTATFVQEVLVPAGTRLQRSRALPAFGRRGGAEQFELLDAIPNENFRLGVPLQ